MTQNTYHITTHSTNTINKQNLHILMTWTLIGLQCDPSAHKPYDFSLNERLYQRDHWVNDSIGQSS